MKREEEMEKILRAAPAPRLRAGMHRQLLKAQLLEAMEKGARPMTNVSWKRSLAWVCALALALTSAAWGGKKAYRILIEKKWSAQQTAQGMRFRPEYKVTGADGREVTGPEREEAIKLAEQGAEKSRKILVEAEPGGGTAFIHQVQQPDGTRIELRDEQNLAEAIWAGGSILTDVKKDPKTGSVIVTAIVVMKDNATMRVTARPLKEPWESSPIRELPELARQGKGSLVETRALKDGKTLKVYEFTLSGGQKVKWGEVSEAGGGGTGGATEGSAKK